MTDAKMSVPLLDLKGQYEQIRSQVEPRIARVIESQYFILGPEVEALEEQVAAYCRSPHAVGVSSGTDALIVSLMTAGIGPGDAVITTPFTFFATVGAIVRVGARPVFVDIDPQTYTMDPKALHRLWDTLSAVRRERIKAVVPIHLYGQCADMDPILAFARDKDLVVIEDAAQAIGAEYKGRRAGSMGEFGCFSFFPSKNLGAFGDGGIVTVAHKAAWEKMKMLRVHGGRTKYHHDLVGGNFRLDALQAAVVSAKLPFLDGWTAARRRNADRYRTLLADAGLLDKVAPPVDKGWRHIYNQFVVRVTGDRDGLRRHLADNQVGCEVYYPVPLHLQPCFADLGYRAGDFPVAEKAAETTLALPIYPELTEDQQAYVVEQIRSFFR